MTVKTPALREVPQGEAAQLMTALVKAASDNSISTEKMTALYELRVRMLEREARLEFNAALARAQAEFPTVERHGRIVMYSKKDREFAEQNRGEMSAGAKPIQETQYPLYEDIRDAITPALSAEGLSLSFQVETVATGDSYRIVVVGFLKHSLGHVETVKTPPLQHDTTGSKNAVQAVKSTVSYGKRLATELLTNVASRGDDDDGAHGAPTSEGRSGPDLITDAQVAILLAEIADQGGSTMSQISKAFGITDLTQLKAADYDTCVMRLAERRKAATGKAKR